MLIDEHQQPRNATHAGPGFAILEPYFLTGAERPLLFLRSADMLEIFAILNVRERQAAAQKHKSWRAAEWG